MKKFSLLKCQRFCYLFAALLLLSFVSQAQSDTIFYGKSYKRVSSKDQAFAFRTISKQMVDGVYEVLKYENDTLIMKGGSTLPDTLIEQGKFTYFNNKGNVSREEMYENGKCEGIWKAFYENGKVHWIKSFSNHGEEEELVVYYENGSERRREHYKKGKSISGTCYDELGNEVSYFPFETMPEFPGGINKMMKFLVDKIQYPKEAKKKKIEGRVLVRFRVEEDGSLNDLAVVRSVEEAVDNEVLRVISSMPRWKPGMQDGKTVKVYFTLPVVFRIH